MSQPISALGVNGEVPALPAGSAKRATPGFLDQFPDHPAKAQRKAVLRRAVPGNAQRFNRYCFATRETRAAACRLTCEGVAVA
ncbi:hypothetical protein, partial [Paraburkholderia xenovorans]|uniref:hypothetical protein n=1 Tax=Paraburkholderia xenovorans TaxID=36873 RepID=UPI0038BA5BB4